MALKTVVTTRSGGCRNHVQLGPIFGLGGRLVALFDVRHLTEATAVPLWLLCRSAVGNKNHSPAVPTQWQAAHLCFCQFHSICWDHRSLLLHVGAVYPLCIVQCIQSTHYRMNLTIYMIHDT